MENPNFLKDLDLEEKEEKATVSPMKKCGTNMLLCSIDDLMKKKSYKKAKKPVNNLMSSVEDLLRKMEEEITMAEDLENCIDTVTNY